MEVINMHHEGEKKLECETCGGMKFENEEEMKKHEKEAHGGGEGHDHEHDQG